MSKFRTMMTGIRTDAQGIRIIVSVADEDDVNHIALSGDEASELIQKLRCHIDEMMVKSKWYSPEDWK